MNSSEKKFKLIDFSFKMIEDYGWQSFSLKKLSESQEIPFEEVTKILKSKESLLREFTQMIDIKVEKDFDYINSEDTSIKDNLFELIMLRLDYMQSYKKALKSIINFKIIV